jgi:polyisoprenoid-binding protein YceI
LKTPVSSQGCLELEGTVTIERDPGASTIRVSIDAASLGTHNAKRDADLRGPDFFHTDRYSTIRYERHGVEPSPDG